MPFSESYGNCPGTPLYYLCVSNYAIPGPVEVDVSGSRILDTNLSIDNGVQVQDTNSSAFNPFPDHVEWSFVYSLGISGPLASELALYNSLTISFNGSPSTLNTSQIPVPFPGLNEWAYNSVVFDTSLPNYAAGSFGGSITSLTSTVITPEPSVSRMLLVALAAIWLGRCHRFKARSSR